MAAAKTASKRAKSEAAEPVREIQLLGPPPDGVVDPRVAQLMADGPLEGEVGHPDSGQVVEQERFEPQQFIPIEKFGPPKGLYPEGAELFAFTPREGDTIWFPMEFPAPTHEQVWEQYDLPWNVQTWQWMKWANVPKDMQRKAVQLADRSLDEYVELFNQWMAATGRVPRGGKPLGK